MGRAFGPFPILGPVSWAAGPGWYEIAPLALENSGGMEFLWLGNLSTDIARCQYVTCEPYESAEKLLFGRPTACATIRWATFCASPRLLQTRGQSRRSNEQGSYSLYPALHREASARGLRSGRCNRTGLPGHKDRGYIPRTIDCVHSRRWPWRSLGMLRHEARDDRVRNRKNVTVFDFVDA